MGEEYHNLNKRHRERKEKAMDKSKKREGVDAGGGKQKRHSSRGCFITRQVSRMEWPELMLALSSLHSIFILVIYQPSVQGRFEEH